tara:strand:- start:240 stop:575 length:336 start_codon:yes stop_codon:yes gene_type:complete
MTDYITKKKKVYITKKKKETKEKFGDDSSSEKKQYITKKKKPSKGIDRHNFAGGGRTRLLEELGRVEAEPSNANRRAEISRVHGELNKGYKTGGRVGFKDGTKRPKGGWTN